MPRTMADGAAGVQRLISAAPPPVDAGGAGAAVLPEEEERIQSVTRLSSGKCSLPLPSPRAHRGR